MDIEMSMLVVAEAAVSIDIALLMTNPYNMNEWMDE